MFTVDFTKAFDSVKHMPLMQKMELLQLPDHIYNWLVHYFEARGHSTRLGNIISTVAAINASIIPGAEHVGALQVLGVTLNSRLAMGDHIGRVISTCLPPNSPFAP